MLPRICLAFGLVAFAFTATAGAPTVPKPMAQDLTVEVVQAQQELAVDVPDSNAGMVGAQFGLLGALVGSAIGSAIENSAAKKAEANVAPIRDQLIGFDFNARFEQAVRAKLASEGISTKPQFVFLSPVAMAERDEKNGERALKALVLRPRYSMDNAFNSMTVSIGVALVDRERKSNGKYKERQAFFRNYSFHFPLDLPSAQNPKQWADLGKPTLTALLDQGITQSVDMVVYDFSDEGRAQWEQSNKKMFAPLKGRRYPGMALRTEQDYVWVRTGKRYMQTVQGYQVVSGPLATAASVAATAPAAPAVADAPAAPAAAEAQDAGAPQPVETPAASPAAAGGTQ